VVHSFQLQEPLTSDIFPAEGNMVCKDSKWILFLQKFAYCHSFLQTALFLSSLHYVVFSLPLRLLM